jgi:pimeloyl-ACP methyl ester carboxylesterase
MRRDIATSADGISIAYELHGEASPALIFVHGWSCDRSYWAGQVEPFSQQFTVIAIDLAGHGESGVERTAWTIESFGDDVAAVVKEVGLERIILIGHSMGGNVIAEAARRLLGRVIGMVWVDTYKQLGRGRTSEEIRTFMAGFRANFVDATRTSVRDMFPTNADRSLVDRVAMDMSAAPPTVALGALESTFGYSREMPRSLDELKLRVIAINPDYKPTDVASLERHGVQVMLMPGAGHFLMMEDPERFNGFLRAAIDKLVQ